MGNSAMRKTEARFWMLQNSSLSRALRFAAVVLGIGLVIVKSIVEAHGGSVDARNHPQGGAVFKVTLRISQELAPEPITATALH